MLFVNALQVLQSSGDTFTLRGTIENTTFVEKAPILNSRVVNFKIENVVKSIPRDSLDDSHLIVLHYETEELTHFDIVRGDGVLIKRTQEGPDVVFEAPRPEMPKNESFLIKYWYYILPVMLILLVGGGEEPPKK